MNNLKTSVTVMSGWLWQNLKYVTLKNSTSEDLKPVVRMVFHIKKQTTLKIQ